MSTPPSLGIPKLLCMLRADLSLMAVCMIQPPPANDTGDLVPKIGTHCFISMLIPMLLAHIAKSLDAMDVAAASCKSAGLTMYELELVGAATSTIANPRGKWNAAFSVLTLSHTHNSIRMDIAQTASGHNHCCVCPVL